MLSSIHSVYETYRMRRGFFIWLLVTSYFPSVPLLVAEAQEQHNVMNTLIGEIKKSVVFLGKFEEQKITDQQGGSNDKTQPVYKPQFSATGFLVSIQGATHLITAKHVVINPENGESRDEDMTVFFNLKNGKVGMRSLKEIKKLGVNWIFHENKDVDIAIIPFGLDIQNDDVRTIPSDIFLGTDRLFELYDIFFLSYQPGAYPLEMKKILPVIRSGTISLMNEDKTFYVDAFAFPGNSGSPVFLTPSPFRFDEKGGVTFGDPLGGKFIGIIGQYLPYQEVAVSLQTHRPRVVFEENTGLAKVWSVGFINQLIDSEPFKQQLSGLVGK